MDAGIFVFEDADELDVVGPHRVLAGVEDVRARTGAPPLRVHLVAERRGPVRLGGGLIVEPTATFRDCPHLDVLFVPGGSSGSETAGRRIEQRNAAAVEFIRERARQARLTASVCTGAFLLAEAGLLGGRRANTHWMYRDELVRMMEARGETFFPVAERVVWDGDGLVTGGGVTSGIDVALSIVERLCGAPTRDALAAVLERETPPAS